MFFGSGKAAVDVHLKRIRCQKAWFKCDYFLPQKHSRGAGRSVSSAKKDLGIILPLEHLLSAQITVLIWVAAALCGVTSTFLEFEGSLQVPAT